MDCNKDEAIRAKGIAERKMGNNDFEGARKIVLKAKNLYPELENITQMLSICDVHCSAQTRLLGSEKDWYGILQVEKLADEQTIKKQYRRLALILHPDKNRFPGAEGAFKLISEANALLSDTAKKSLYDNRIRVLCRSGPVNPPNHYINRSSQPNKQHSAQNNVSNGFSSLNQHEGPQSFSSAKLDVFWTCCPYCKMRYQYLRQYINRTLHCPSCSKGYTAHEVSGKGGSSGSKMVQEGTQPKPPKPVSRQPSGFQDKAVPNPGDIKMNAENVRGPSSTRTESQQTAGKKTVPPEPGVRTRCGSQGVHVPGASGNLKTEKAEYHNASSDNDAIQRERRDERSKRPKGGKKTTVEANDSSDTEMEDLTMRENEMESESSDARFVRRSSRKRNHISYEETDEEDRARALKRAQAAKVDKGKEQKVAVDSKDSKRFNGNNLHTAADYRNAGETGTAQSNESMKDKDAYCDKEGKATGKTAGMSGAFTDAVEIESDSPGDTSSSTKSVEEVFQCPDAEFSDFDKVRDENRFHANQIWACYDTLDGMPRFYAKVKKVRTSPFELHITWLEAQPIDETYEEWVDEELPVGCGSFKLGTSEKTPLRLSFSHLMHCENGKKRGYLTIHPRKGEVWALFKDWDKSWSSDPDNHKNFKYEIIEVLSDFVPGTGIKVVYLDKVTGFVSLFQRASQSETNSFVIGVDELYKFSHLVPFFKMTGSEREGVPIGSFELDPASLPLNPDDLYYPSKAEATRKDMDPGVDGSLPKYADSKGNNVASAETSKTRSSPKGVNVSKKNRG